MRRRRPAFTLIEMTAVMAITLVVLGLITSLTVWNFRERAAQQARQFALENAANILEQARATPWNSLTVDWAESRRLDESPWLPDGKLDVLVTDEPNNPGLKRVTAKVSWRIAAERPRLNVELIGFFADTAVKGKPK